MGYQLQKQVRQKEEVRTAYCKLAEKTFGLDFEAWYQKGYWTDAHIPYTLFDRLFVLRDKENIFAGKKLLFPVLSHT